MRVWETVFARSNSVLFSSFYIVEIVNSGCNDCERVILKFHVFFFLITTTSYPTVAVSLSLSRFISSGTLEIARCFFFSTTPALPLLLFRSNNLLVFFIPPFFIHRPIHSLTAFQFALCFVEEMANKRVVQWRALAHRSLACHPIPQPRKKSFSFRPYTSLSFLALSLSGNAQRIRKKAHGFTVISTNPNKNLSR